MHLSFSSPWSTPGEPMGSPGEWSRFGISFFPAGEGSWLVSEKTFMDHGDIPTGFVWGSATDEVKNASPGSMLDVKKRTKKLHTFLCDFLPRKAIPLGCPGGWPAGKQMISELRPDGVLRSVDQYWAFFFLFFLSVLKICLTRFVLTK